MSGVMPEFSPPIGGKKRGRPPKQHSLKQIAAQYHIKVRNLERAIFVRRYGVSELVALAERGELNLRTAEYVARWSHEEQREACARGSAYIRKLVPLVRADEREEKDESRQLAEKRLCPHCGGELAA